MFLGGDIPEGFLFAKYFDDLVYLMVRHMVGEVQSFDSGPVGQEVFNLLPIVATTGSHYLSDGGLSFLHISIPLRRKMLDSVWLTPKLMHF